MASAGGSATKTNPGDGVGARLGTLEREMAGFQGEVRTQIGGLRDALTALTGEMRNLAQRVTRPANLGWMFGGAGTLIALTAWLVRMGAAPHLDNLAELRLANLRVQESAISSAHARGRLEGDRDHAARSIVDLVGRVAMLEDEDYDRAEATRDLAPLRADLEVLRRDLRAHEMGPGHGHTLARLEGLDRILADLTLRVTRAEDAIAGASQISARVDSLQRAIDQLRTDVVAWRSADQAGP